MFLVNREAKRNTPLLPIYLRLTIVLAVSGIFFSAPAAAQCTVAPTATPLQPTCLVNTGTITVTSPAPGGGTTYSINGTTYTNTTGLFTLLSPGTYSVTAKLASGCITPALQVTLNNPSMPGTITPASATFCANGSQVLTATSGGTTYLWYRVGTVPPVATTAANTYTATQAGTYYAVIVNGVCSTQTTNNSVINVVSPPSGGVSPATATICAGSSVTLTATGGGTYQWFKNGTLQTVTSATYTANDSGTYSVIISNGVCTASASNTARVSLAPAPSGTVTPSSASICAGSNQLLTVSGGTTGTPGTLFQWYNNNIGITGATDATFSATDSGTYSVDIISSSSAGGCKARSSNSARIVVTPLPGGSISPASVSFCQGSSATLTATGGVTYQWYKNGVAQNNFTAAYSVTDSGRYAVEIFDAGGCKGKSSNESVVTVTRLPSVPISPAAAVVCPGSSLTLTVSGGTTYQWYRNDTVITGATSATYAATQAGRYKVDIFAGTCKGGSSNVSVLTSGVPNLVITNPAKLCPGTTVNLQAPAVTAGSDAGLSFSYWKDANGSTPVPTPSAVTEGTYYIRAANANCSVIKPVVVTAQTVFPGSITSGRTTACLTDSLPLTASGGVSYQWFKNDSSISGATKVTYYARQSGVYSVSISDGICPVKASNTVTLEFKACTPIFDAQVFVPTAFTPNRNGANDVLRPIFYNVTALTYFKVYNRWGQQVFQTTIAGKGWDGNKEGVPQPPETYSWILECVGKNGEIIKQSGKSFLIR